MASSVGLWALTPFGADRGAEDIILLLLLMLLLLPALMQMWVGSLMSRSVDALLYNRGHIFFRNLVHRVSVGTYTLLGGLQRHLLVGVTGCLLLRYYGGLPTGELWTTLSQVGALALGSLMLNGLYLGVNRLLAGIYLDSAFYLHWVRHYSILEWLWPLPLYISSLLLLAGVWQEVALWLTVAVILLWRLAIILPTARWLGEAGVTPLLISLYLCSQEVAPLAYLVGFGMLIP